MEVLGIVPPADGGPERILKSIACAFKELGMTVRYREFNTWTARTFLALGLHIAATRAQVVFVRHEPPAAPAIAIGILIARLRRRRVILMVPTPLQSALLERRPVTNRAKRYASRQAMRVAHPLVYRLASVVVMNAREAPQWASANSVVIPNPAHEIVRRPRLSIATESLRVIGVANNPYSHGFIRLLQALPGLLDDYPGASISVNLVGPASAFEEENDYVRQGNLSRIVSFAGKLTGAAFHDALGQSDIGLGLLRGDKIQLTEASPLKHRSYIANGLPFVSSVAELSLSKDSSFIHFVKGDESSIDLNELFNWYQSLSASTLAREQSEWFAENAPLAYAQRVLRRRSWEKVES